MSSVPYSRYVIYPVPWYSFLIVVGVVLAVILACREERRSGLPKDTVVDLALWLIPCGIIGARIYYVVFSWDQFRNDFLSVFRIWEGGIAIYGGVIGGLLALLIFARCRRCSPLLLCDMIAPGLSLAQCIGRWGNWFNIEAYGWKIDDPSLCFFPLAVQVPSDGYSWHLAAFFYESVWDLAVFLVLILLRRRRLKQKGDIFLFYLLLYAAGRLVIEELRLDSLYTGSSVRVSQLLSVLICIGVLMRYIISAVKKRVHFSKALFPVAAAACTASALAVLYSLSVSFFTSTLQTRSVLFLSLYAIVMIFSLFFIRLFCLPREVYDAHD